MRPPLALQLARLRAQPVRRLRTTTRNLLLSPKNNRNFTEFNGEGSEKSTTRFLIRESLNWELTVLCLAPTGTSTPATSIYCLHPELPTRPVCWRKLCLEKRMLRNLASTWNACSLSTTTTITSECLSVVITPGLATTTQPSIAVAGFKPRRTAH